MNGEARITRFHARLVVLRPVSIAAPRIRDVSKPSLADLLTPNRLDIPSQMGFRTGREET